MATLEQLIGDYMDASISPADMQKLALMQVANSSVQDDAVGKAVSNLQGVESKNRSALEQYMLAQEEAAKAEADKAVEYASKRLSEITQALTMFGTIAGLSKAQKEEMEALKRERDKILKAFPQLGFASDGGVSTEGNAVNGAGNVLESNDLDDWRKFAKSASIDEIANLYDEAMGEVNPQLEKMLSYRMHNSPELTIALKLDPKYRNIAHLANSTLGDDLAAADDEKKGKQNAKKLKWANDTLKPFIALGDRRALQAYATRHPEIVKAAKILKKNDAIGGVIDKLRIVGINP